VEEENMLVSKHIENFLRKSKKINETNGAWSRAHFKKCRSLPILVI